MTNNIQSPTSSVSSTASGMRSEIALKWDKLSSAEIAALKNNDDLIAQVQSKYSLDRAKAQSEVESFAKGRLL